MRGEIPRAAVLAGILSVACATPEDDARGPHPVGITTLELHDPTRQRTLVAEVWYPAEEGVQEEWSRPLPLIQPLWVARDAALAPGAPRPLVLVSHGALGFRFAQGWLATNLASHGYVVAAVDHPGSMLGDLTGEGMFTLWNRALDVSVLLDDLLDDPRFGDALDPERISFVSHSAGGHTGLLLAGARFDPAVFRAYRLAGPPDDIYAERLAPMEAIDLEVDHTPYERSYRDPRIRSFVLMAPSPVPGFSAESLAALEQRMLIFASAHDEINPLDAHARFVAEHVDHSVLEMIDAGHFVYIPIGSFLGEVAAPELFVDAGEVDRGAIHGSIRRKVRSFLDAQPVAED